jgi:hypothetical protein
LAWIPPYDKKNEWDRTFRVARHESGHYVVARALGFRAGPCSIRIDTPNGHIGTAGIEPISSIASLDDVGTYIERRVQVLYAGVLAEAMPTKEIELQKALTYTKDSGLQDHAKVRELIHILRNIRYPGTIGNTHQELNDIDLALWNRSASIVCAERRIIHKLAKYLASGVTAYGQSFELSIEALDTIEPILKRFGRTKSSA